MLLETCGCFERLPLGGGEHRTLSRIAGAPIRRFALDSRFWKIDSRRSKPTAEHLARWVLHEHSEKKMRNPGNRRRPAAVTMILGMLPLALSLLAGCSTASTQYKSRPFFLTEEEVATHGRKAWYDRVVELDPGRAEFTVAADYQQAPPKRVAVLPFTDLGEGEFVVDKVPLLPRSDQDRARWGWSHANRVRRAFAGEVATREFTLIPLWQSTRCSPIGVSLTSISLAR